jgi:hypothetical protein
LEKFTWKQDEGNNSFGPLSSPFRLFFFWFLWFFLFFSVSVFRSSCGSFPFVSVFSFLPVFFGFFVPLPFSVSLLPILCFLTLSLCLSLFSFFSKDFPPSVSFSLCCPVLLPSRSFFLCSPCSLLLPPLFSLSSLRSLFFSPLCLVLSPPLFSSFPCSCSSLSISPSSVFLFSVVQCWCGCDGEWQWLLDEEDDELTMALAVLVRLSPLLFFFSCRSPLVFLLVFSYFLPCVCILLFISSLVFPLSRCLFFFPLLFPSLFFFFVAVHPLAFIARRCKRFLCRDGVTAGEISAVEHGLLITAFAAATVSPSAAM